MKINKKINYSFTTEPFDVDFFDGDIVHISRRESSSQFISLHLKTLREIIEAVEEVVKLKGEE